MQGHAFYSFIGCIRRSALFDQYIIKQIFSSTSTRKVAYDSYSSHEWGGEVENMDFGRDTTRLYYFKVYALDVYGDDNLPGNIDSYGGGGKKAQQVPVGNFTNYKGGDGELVDRKLDREMVSLGDNASQPLIGGKKREGGLPWWRRCWPRLSCKRV